MLQDFLCFTVDLGFGLMLAQLNEKNICARHETNQLSIYVYVTLRASYTNAG
jgi:hypothetical protein